MPDFNPALQDTGVENFSNRSQGTGPNQAFASLFSGLTDTLGNFAEAKDNETKKAIYDDATAAFDSVNAEFGLTPTESGSFEGQTPPASMQTELDRIATLQAAKEQGKISEVNYYGRLATLSKQLRAKYPRYEAIVDQTIQSVTGTRPANAYRDAIFSEMNTLASEASSEEKFKRQWIKENEGYLSMVYGDDFFRNSDDYNFDQVRATVARFKGRKEMIDSQIADLNLESKQGEVNDKTAAKTISQDFSFVVETELNKALTQNGPSFNQRLEQFVKGPQNPADLDQMISAIGVAENNLRTALLQKGTRDYSSVMTQTDINKAVDAAMYPLEQAKTAILGGDFKLGSRYATLSKAMTDQQLNEMLKASPELRVGAGLSEISKTIGDNYLSSVGVDAISNLGLEIAGRTMAGQEGLVKSVVESGNSKVSRSVIDREFSILTDTKVTGQDVSNIVDEMFGPKAVDWMDPKVVDANDIEGLYLKFLDPKVTKAIKERGTPEDLKTYTDWALEKFAAIPAFRKAAGDVNDTLPEGVKIGYDEDNKRLVLLGDGPSASMPGSFSMRGMGTARATISSLNKALAVLGPIIDANGADGRDIIPHLIKDLNVELEHSEEEGFFGHVFDALMQPINREGLADEIIQPYEGKFFRSGEDTFDGIIDFTKKVGRDLMQPIPKAPEDQTPAGPDTKGIDTGLLPYLTGGKGKSSLRFKPEFSSNLERFLKDAPGEGIRIYSGYRSPAYQAGLFRKAVAKHGSIAAARKWVAPPGRSHHGKGDAADLRFASPSVRKWAHENAEKYGLHFPLSNESWHIELAGSRG